MNTINGRTPEEIKKGLECCKPKWNSNHWVSCNSECPYRYEGAFCRNVLLKDNIALIQQLERERDAAVERCVNADDVSAGYYQEIQQLESAQPKWISVEDRLPESGKESLVLICYRNRNYPAHPGVVDSCYYDGRMAECGVREFERINEPQYVTHWMPIPLPPKENPQ